VKLKQTLDDIQDLQAEAIELKEIFHSTQDSES